MAGEAMPAGGEARRWLTYALVVAGTAGLAALGGFNIDQVQATAVFVATVAGALIFWRYRLAFALAGLSLLLAMGLTDIDTIVEFAGLDIILFLIGMMVLIGYLETRRFFDRIVDALSAKVGARPYLLVTVVMVAAAVSAALVDEVTSILFMTATVFKLCRRYRLNPVPLLIMAVVATNIGSAATVVGNPVGVIVALRSGLGFSDFLRWATPISVAALVVAVPIMMLTFRGWIGTLRHAMRSAEAGAAGGEPAARPLFTRDMALPWTLFGGTLLALISHTETEALLGIKKNSMLLGTALASASLVLALERERARDLFERKVEWWTLAFFLALFATVSTLSLTGVTGEIATRLADLAGGNQTALFLIFTWTGGIASAFMDNVLAVSTLIPVVQDLEALGNDVFPLWWGMLFAGTFFGNLTIIGSTANIVAVGLLEKEKLGQVTMWQSVKATAVVSVVTLGMATLILWAQLLA
jgi:Na+/H+ antiporter NhaD/arsenite permease-like protein